MAKKKKIFNEADFNKEKQLFTSDDFEKDVNSEFLHGERPTTTKQKKWWWFLLFAIVAIIVAFFCMENSFSDGKPVIKGEQITAVPDTVSVQKTDEATDLEEGTAEETVATKQNTVNEEYNSENVVEKAAQPVAEEKQDSSKKPSSIQKTVALQATSTVRSSALSGDLEENALRTIRGDFGNGEERKAKLGSEYSAIQKKVNEMYAKGLVY